MQIRKIAADLWRRPKWDICNLLPTCGTRCFWDIGKCMHLHINFTPRKLMWIQGRVGFPHQHETWQLGKGREGNTVPTRRKTILCESPPRGPRSLFIKSNRYSGELLVPQLAPWERSHQLPIKRVICRAIIITARFITGRERRSRASLVELTLGRERRSRASPA